MTTFADTIAANIATSVFKTNTPLLAAIPRIKFNFFVEFLPTNEASAMMNNLNLNIWQGQSGIAFKVKTIDKPKVTLETQTLNQYNKKRQIYTGISYGDASIKLHDTVDDSVLTFWVNYFTYFFADSRASIAPGSENINASSKYSSFLQSPVQPLFDDNTGWGFRPISSQTLFFNGIRVWALFNQTYTRFTYLNPRITSFDWDHHDSGSSDGEEVTINFKYEGILYEAFGQQMASNDLATIGQPLVSAITNIIPRQQASLFSSSTTSMSNLTDGSVIPTGTNAAIDSEFALNSTPTLGGNPSSSLTSTIGQTPQFG